MKTFSGKEMKTTDNKGHKYLMRARPYITIDKRIDGVVFAFTDFDSYKHKDDKARNNA